jgi:hypothetical protein
MRTRVFNAAGESKQFVGEKIPAGWFATLEQAKASVPEKVISDEMQAKCDARLSDRYGLSRASFIRLNNMQPNGDTVRKYGATFAKIVEAYGDRIEKVDMGHYEVYKWRQQPQ